MSSHNTQKNHNSQSVQGKTRELNSGTNGVFPFWKHPGETLAVMLRRFRDEHNVDSDEKLTYAGRLDPMAEGIVPILAGEARFQKDHMLNASKTYEVMILLGIGTDTGDVLGLATLISARTFLASTAEIEAAIKTIAETVSLPYPNYSSIPVDGKPLFMHARANNAVVLPIKKVTIYSLELLKIETVTLSKILSDAIEIIKKVHGDFRQGEILEQWSEMAATDGDKQIQMVTIRTTVSSGTYMRSLAEKMGKLLGVPALAYKITRTHVGEIK